MIAVGNILNLLMRSRASMTVASTASKMVSRVGIFLAVAPILGPSNQGTLVTTSAWSAVVALVVAYGLQVRILRLIPETPIYAKSLLKSDLLAMIVLTGPAFVCFTIIAAFFIPDHEWVVFFFVFLATLCSVVIDYISCALRALDSFAAEAKISVFSSLLQFGLVVSAGFATSSLVIISVALLVSRTIIASISLLTLFQNKTVKQSATAPSNAFAVIITSWKYFFDATLSVGLSQIDILVLNFMADRETVGIYAAGSRLIQLAMVIPWMVTNLFVPALAASPNQIARETKTRALAKGMLGLALLGSVSIIIFGPLFVNFLLGDKFLALNSLWPLFAVMLLARFFESYFGIILTSLGKMGMRVAAQTFALLAIAGLSLIFIPLLAAKGLILVLSVVSVVTGLFYGYALDQNRRRFIRISASVIILLGITALALL